MPSKDSKIVSARIPNNLEFKIPISKVLTSVYAGLRNGKLRINGTGIAPMADCNECLKGLPQESDPDGEWVREMAHEINTDVKTFKRHVEQGMRR